MQIYDLVQSRNLPLSTVGADEATAANITHASQQLSIPPALYVGKPTSKLLESAIQNDTDYLLARLPELLPSQRLAVFFRSDNLTNFNASALFNVSNEYYANHSLTAPMLMRWFAPQTGQAMTVDRRFKAMKEQQMPAEQMVNVSRALPDPMVGFGFFV